MAANMIFLSRIGDTVVICYFQMHYAILDVNLFPHAKYYPSEQPTICQNAHMSPFAEIKYRS